jgi:hypothetical protein
MTARTRAEYRFFQRQPHRLGANRVDQAEYNHLVGEQLQGPLAAPAQWVSTGQFDQFLFNVSFDLDLVRSSRPWPGIESHIEPLGDESLPDTSDGPKARVQGRNDVLVAVSLAMDGIRQEHDTGMSQVCGLRPCRQKSSVPRPFVHLRPE